MNETGQDSSRHIEINFIGNLRDLGGYPTQDGRVTAWGKLFRSAEPKHRSEDDVALLREKTGIASVLDLRGSSEAEEEGIGLLDSQDICYHNIPLLGNVSGAGFEDEAALFSRISSMGEFYVLMMINHNTFASRLIEALEFISDPKNQPVLFHCAVGKDRTGLLAAAILNILGVDDDHVINDYHLTAQHMPAFLDQLKRSSQEAAVFMESFPAFMWEAEKSSMEMVLDEIQQQHGSFRNYLVTGGCDPSLFNRLEDTLLEDSA